MSLISRMLPAGLKLFIKKMLYRGDKFCPVCQSSVSGFLPFGITAIRPEAICPVCGSLERHRLIWQFMKDETNLFSATAKRMLHVAPEPCFSSRLMTYDQIDYLTADICDKAMVVMDIMDIQYPDDSFDVIYCSHVLEHVPDDMKAMREFARALKPTGWAILQVPIDADKTFEDSSVTNPAERERLFGQYDHLRVYGPDYKERLEEAGFAVTVVEYHKRFTEAELERIGLKYERDDIYLCTLNGGSQTAGR